MNELATLLGIDFPLIQAGMGGVAGTELAAAVAAAGAGGVVGLYRMPPAQIRPALRRVRELTPRPFGVNLIPELMQPSELAAQVDAVLCASDRSVFLTYYGLPDEAVCETMLRAGRAFLVMVGCVAAMQSAQTLEASGIVLQGIEAGGHLLGTQRLRDLLGEARDSGCRTPVLGAGGISSGHDLRELQKLGASGCVCGTLFVATDESNAHRLYKDRLVQAQAADTIVTDLFDIGWRNRRHRVLRNALTQQSGAILPRLFIAETQILGRRHPIPRYSAMVPTGQTQGNIGEMAMYCGESVSGVHAITSARHRVESFVAQFRSPASGAPHRTPSAPTRADPS